MNKRRERPPLSDRGRRRALRTWGFYLLALTAWVTVVLAAVFLGYLVCSAFTWYAWDPLYQFLNWVRDYIVFVCMLVILLGWVAISYSFIARPMRLVDTLAAAAEQLAQPGEEPIELPEPMEDLEGQLNAVRERALRDARAAREAEQRKNDLVVYLAHDLKTPLTSVIGYLTLLRDEPQLSPELRSRYTGIALEKAERLEDLINEFFDITRFSLTHLELEKQPTDLTRMLEQVASEFAPQFAEKDLRCELELPPRLAYDCDPDKLARVFDNLLRWDGEKSVSAVAQSWQETSNDDGTVTYTFHLRGDAVWSDGSRLTAADFVYAWKRLVSPDTASPNAAILSVVSGYDEARAGDVDALQVSAPDDHTLEVTLTGPCAYFLNSVCTAPATMPVRQKAVESDDDWASSRTYFVGNGPFRRGGDWTDYHRLTLHKQEGHYSAKHISLDRVELVLQTEEQAAANVIQGHSLKMEGRRRRAQEAAQQAEQLRRQLAAMEDRIRLLTEMEKDYEGFSRAVKGVMQAADRGTLSGIHGPVASLMTTDPQYTVALEIALGAALQNIVVDRDTDAKEAIAFLKRRDAGRATFLPMSAIRGDMLREPRLAQEYGFVGIASQLVTYDARYDGIFQNLLGRTVVVEDLDCGVNMARRYQNRFRIVTLDGQVINRGGSMTGGSVSRSAGVLSRASELSGLREQLTGLKASLDQAAHRAEETGRDLQKAQYELDVAREQQQNAAQQVLALETRGQHYDSLRETLEATLEALDAENLRLTRQTADGDARRRELQTEIDGQEDLARQLRQQAQNCLAGQSDLQSKTGGISDRITRCKEQQAALAAERQGAESRLADLRQLMTDLDGDCRSREDLARQLHESQVRAREQMAEHQTRCDSLHRQAEDLRGQLQTLQQEKLDLEQQRTALNRQTQTCNDAVIAAQQELSRLEQKRSAAAMEEKTILDKLWERYELSHSEAQAQRVELESVPKAQRRVGEGGGLVDGEADRPVAGGAVVILQVDTSALDRKAHGHTSFI